MRAFLGFIFTSLCVFSSSLFAAERALISQLQRSNIDSIPWLEIEGFVKNSDCEMSILRPDRFCPSAKMVFKVLDREIYLRLISSQTGKCLMTFQSGDLVKEERVYLFGALEHRFLVRYKLKPLELCTNSPFVGYYLDFVYSDDKKKLLTAEVHYYRYKDKAGRIFFTSPSGL